MATNSFECPYCKKVTRHIEISAREASALADDSEFDQLANGINDAVGITKAFSTITGRKYWKCCTCGYAALRATSGKIVSVVIQKKFLREALDNQSKGIKSGF